MGIKIIVKVRRNTAPGSSFGFYKESLGKGEVCYEKGNFRKDKRRFDCILSGTSEEPLHSSYIMSRMAYAAMEGGAVGIGLIR